MSSTDNEFVVRLHLLIGGLCLVSTLCERTLSRRRASEDDASFYPGGDFERVLSHSSAAHGANSDKGAPACGHVRALQLIEVQDQLAKLVGGPSGVHLLDLAGYLGRGLAQLARKEFTTIGDVRSAMSALRSSLG